MIKAKLSIFFKLLLKSSGSFPSMLHDTFLFCNIMTNPYSTMAAKIGKFVPNIQASIMLKPLPVGAATFP